MKRHISHSLTCNVPLHTGDADDGEDSDASSGDEPSGTCVREISLTHQPVAGGGFLFHPSGKQEGRRMRPAWHVNQFLNSHRTMDHCPA